MASYWNNTGIKLVHNIIHCGQSITAYSVRLMFATVCLLKKSNVSPFIAQKVYFLLFLSHICHAYASWIFNLYKSQFRFVTFIVCPVIIVIFRKNFRKNAQKVLKRLSNICTQHTCQINSIFISYTLPLSQNFIYNSYNFYAHNN